MEVKFYHIILGLLCIQFDHSSVNVQDHLAFISHNFMKVIYLVMQFQTAIFSKYSFSKLHSFLGIVFSNS